MSFGDRFTKKARARLTEQVGPGEQVLYSATVGPVGIVLTGKRLMLAPYVRGTEPDVNLSLGSIHNVTWQHKPGHVQGVMKIYTSSQEYEYRVPKKQAEPAVAAIRQAMTAVV